MAEQDPNDRSVLLVSGEDAESFLQGLVSNDVRLVKAGAVYAALLSAQGKYLADFLLVPHGDGILVDVKQGFAEGLARRLGFYKLRARVQIVPTDIKVTRGLGPAPVGAFADPRDPDLGWRFYDGRGSTGDAIDWDAIRVAQVIPESGIELLPDETYILEAGFERLNGVDFRKGCYVGQEVTARMKHKTELRKGLVQVRIEGAAPVGTEILSGERSAGTLFTQSGDRALAHLRFDRMTDMKAGAARIFAE